MKETIVCAAIKDYLGDIWVGVRHNDCFVAFNRYTEVIDYRRCQRVQGFMTNKHRFVDRQEAHIIAKKNDQIVRRVGGDTNTLYSENLY